jgi:hypothetical protein
MLNPRVDPYYLWPTYPNVNICNVDLILYPKLGTDSKKALTRKNGRWGKPYIYRPRGRLLERLAKDTGLTIYQVRSQLEKERQYLLEQNYSP